MVRVRVLCHTFTGVVQNTLDRVGQMPVEGGHLALRDGILQLLQGGLTSRWGACRVGEVEDMLGEDEVGVLDVLRIRPHDCERGLMGAKTWRMEECGKKGVDGLLSMMELGASRSKLDPSSAGGMFLRPNVLARVFPV